MGYSLQSTQQRVCFSKYTFVMQLQELQVWYSAQICELMHFLAQLIEV